MPNQLRPLRGAEEAEVLGGIDFQYAVFPHAAFELDAERTLHAAKQQRQDAFGRPRHRACARRTVFKRIPVGGVVTPSVAFAAEAQRDDGAIVFAKRHIASMLLEAETQRLDAVAIVFNRIFAGQDIRAAAAATDGAAHLQIPRRLVQRGRRGRVRRQGIVFHGRKQLVPKRRQQRLHVADGTRDRDDHVLFRHHDAILPVRAVAAIDAFRLAEPELESVALRPVQNTMVAVVHLFGCRHVNPFSRNELPSIPIASPQTQFAEFRDVFRPQIQPPAACRNAGGACLPHGPHDAQRLEKARHEIIHEIQAGLAGDQRRQHVGTQTVVDERRARLVGDLLFEERLLPVLHAFDHHLRRVAHLLAAGHRQQMADGHLLQMVADDSGHLIREQIRHMVIQSEQPFGNGQADGRRREALAQGEKLVRQLRVVRPPVVFVDDLSMAQHHETVHLVVARKFAQTVKTGFQAFAGNALRFGRATFKSA